MLKVLVAISLALALNVGIWKWTRHRERLQEAEVATTPAGHSGTRQPDLSLPPRPRDRGFLGVVLAGESVDVEATVDGRLPPVFVEPGDEVGRGAPIAQVDVRPPVRELRAKRRSRRALAATRVTTPVPRPRVRFAIPEARAREVAIGAPVQVMLEPFGLAAAGAVTSVGPVDLASGMAYAAARLELSPAMAKHLTTGVVVRVHVRGGRAPEAARSVLTSTASGS